ncbi:MAG: hypothetical protein JRH07_03800 [Deltaproteobacteria bacterium]|nr:hypothetical protein [Deltaproteobacteria bacterium]
METFRLPSEIPEEEWPDPSVFIEEAKACVREAQEKGIVIRIMGGMAIYLHSQEHEELWKRLGRLGKKVFTDIDYVSYGKYRAKLLKFFETRGFTINQRMLYLYGKARHIYYGSRIPMVEVFYDKLEMNHTILYAGRLEADSPTLPLAELLLQKIQMVHMNEKDVKDTIVLLRAHEVGDDDDDRINRKAVGERLLSDWGFYYTATSNLKKVRESLTGYDALDEQDVSVVDKRLGELLKYLEEGPKSVRWKLRAKLGTKVKWYNVIDDWDVISKESSETEKE